MSQQPSRTGKPMPFALDMFNLAHIRVAGGAGLGLVAICVLVAVTIPAIGVPLGIGGVLSAFAASVIIRRRRTAGPMRSSAQAGGANTTFRLDEMERVSESRSRLRE